MSDLKGAEKYEQDQEIEETTELKRPGFGQKLKRHCARFWWLHLIIFCIVFLIIALCLVYAAMPKIAQHDVDASSIEFTDLKLLDPSPESITLSETATLRNPSKFTPTLDAFNVSFYVGVNGEKTGDSVLKILLPKVHAVKPSSQVIIESQKLIIQSVEGLATFSTQVLQQEVVENVLEGWTKLRLGALPATDVRYFEVVRQKGLNGLKGFNVTDARVNLTAPAGQPNLRGNAFVPNPSVMTIDLGNVTLTLATDAEGVVGNATIDNMTLRPGNNTLPLIAVIDQTKLLKSTKDGMVDLKITGREAVFNGQHLTYYEKALASNELLLNMNVQQVLKDSVSGH